MGVRCEVISFRGNTSSDLIEVADLFTDITQLARVEKGSRSGRRVADDDADLSMTEVPDKQTEGTGAGRGRGRGRGGRTRTGEVEPISMGGRTSTGGRGRGRPSTAAGSNGTETAAAGGSRYVRTGGLTEADLANAEVFTLDSIDDEGGPVGTDIPVDREDEAGDGTRRRRRRGGRGRGRGRGRDDAPEGAEALDGTEPVVGPEPEEGAEGDERPERTARPERAARPQAPARPVFAEDDEESAPVAPRGPRSTPFGSVWDSQLGTTVPPAVNLGPFAEDEDFDEPEIPEYLIAERNRNAAARGGAGRGPGRGGPRGGRSAYQSAMDRERYGRGGGGGGINRYPDVSGRTGQPGQTAPRDDRSYSRGRDDRPPRDDRPRPAGAPNRSSSSEPWSEVPPELEAMLRAQVAGKAPETTGRAGDRVTESVRVTPDEEPTAVVALEATTAADTAAPKRRTTRKPKADVDAIATTTEAEAGAKPAPEAADDPDLGRHGRGTSGRGRGDRRGRSGGRTEASDHAEGHDVVGRRGDRRSGRR